MKYMLLVTVYLSILQLCIGQQASICSYYGENVKYSQSDICNHLSFKSNEEAENTVDRILSEVGLKRNFIVMECPGTENALAVNLLSETGSIRYIIYDDKFLETITRAVNMDWAALSILAHEIGHHLNEHSLNGNGSRHQTELEADEFSGFILGKLGASESEALAAINKLSPISSSSTHPKKSERLNAIKIGFEKGKAKSSKETIPLDSSKSQKRTTDNPSKTKRNNLFHSTHYTKGSTKDEVLSIQGTPTSFSEFGSTETWYYGASYVEFKNGIVHSWRDIGGNKLKVKMESEYNYTSPYYTKGSTKDEVLSIQGTPTSFSEFGSTETWYYGASYVEFKNGIVHSWSDIGGNKLKVKME